MEKTLEQIKEEYANEQGFELWEDFKSGFYSGCQCGMVYLDDAYGYESHVEEVAIRYASQFQDRIKELKECLTKCERTLREVYECDTTEIELLINKEK